MQFPDFQDFLATLTPERLEEIYGDYQSFEIVEIADISDPRNINNFVAHVMDQTLSHSLKLNLRLLRAYHEWLQAQIQ